MKKLLYLCILNFSFLIQGSQRPPHKGRVHVSDAFQAAYDGSMVNWTTCKIRKALDEKFDGEGNTLLHWVYDEQVAQAVISVTSPNEFKALLKHHNNRGNTPIHEICHRRHPKLLRYMLMRAKQHKISHIVNSQNQEFGDTPLHVAAAHGNVEMGEVLRQYGANTSLTNFKSRRRRPETAQDTAARLEYRKFESMLANTPKKEV